MKVGEKKLNLIYVLIQGFYWMSGCTVVGFAAVFLSHAGLPDSAIGAVCSVGSVCGFLVMTICSSHIDSSPKALLKIISVMQYVVLIICLLLALVHFPPLVCAVAYTVCISFTQALPPAYNTLYSRMRSSGIYADYGIARGFGSFTFSVSSAAVGLLVHRLGAYVLPAIAPILIVPQIIGTAYAGRELGITAFSDSSSRNYILSFIRENRCFSFFILGVGLVMAVNQVYATFLIRICEDCGGNTATMGMLLSYMALLEIPIIMGFTWLRARFSIKKLMSVAFIFYALKAACITAAHTVPALIIACSLHGVCFGILTPASIIYAAEQIKPEEAGMAQSLLAAMPVLLNGILVIVTGILFDTIGLRFSMLLLTVLCAAGCITGLLSLRNSDG